MANNRSRAESAGKTIGELMTQMQVFSDDWIQTIPWHLTAAALHLYGTNLHILLLQAPVAH